MIRKTHDWLRQLLTAVLSRFSISENTFLAILAVIIGVLAGLGNYVLRQLIELIHHGVITQGMAQFAIDTSSWNWNRLYLILFPLCGGILMIPLGAYYAKDLRFGFSRFLEEVNLRGGKVPSRTIFTRGLASAITIGTGGSAGQEGPIAQIGGAIGSKVGQTLQDGRRLPQDPGGLRRGQRGGGDLQRADRRGLLRPRDRAALLLRAVQLHLDRHRQRHEHRGLARPARRPPGIRAAPLRGSAATGSCSSTCCSASWSACWRRRS